MTRPAQSNIKSQHVCKNFHKTIEFIGRRWMGMVIYSLLDGPKRFHEIVQKIDGISDRLLTERLNDLVSEGLVTKRYLDASSKKVEYELTPSGEALKEVVLAILDWLEEKEKIEKTGSI
ncbi:DNA-binding HxlR family transcriptional regulator [Cytobacillus horneckiae]|uniref:Transcriptional regulator n=1 Tax=Cytobacillus horneckiae TaxID=549687 RepID=A0A2N0ZC66_9BACI|nr:helix-turn-helix domain-containing protein [Cytobacillus horneckiae]MBN6885954.1 helix-turn-helix transcriptional regulator [Cytobacillus horneckiae]MCM3177496.1 helix-turn-helix transcriptional regulator [Cytobacillus horneckiae]MEC1155941.1 helix-turn-helix domain-containing protein [Cytobacillus horneckiae]MED2939783.1 helix-turn-helix domain-containing protein [Cytobacillus horneckiae]PKG27089.1 transcriptional regulator [Cytobacillus horneckiae]